MCQKLQRITKGSIPDEDDYAGACQGLVRLQRTYKLDTEKVLSGNIRGKTSINSLLPDDFFYIGKEAIGMMEWGYAAQWLTKALHSSRDLSFLGKVHVHLVRAYLEVSIYYFCVCICIYTQHNYLHVLQDSKCYLTHSIVQVQSNSHITDIPLTQRQRLKYDHLSSSLSRDCEIYVKLNTT